MHPPTHCYKSIRTALSRGFTLVELIIVMVVIVILVTVILSVSEEGLSRKQTSAKVKVEMALMAQALEGYKAYHGDYPWISGDTEALYKALTGQRGPKARSDPGRGSPFIDPDKLTLQHTKAVETFNDTNAFIDPWGNPYHYFYKGEDASETWDTYGFLLISAGPNGELGPVPSNGLIDENYFTSRAGKDDFIQQMTAY